MSTQNPKTSGQFKVIFINLKKGPGSGGRIIQKENGQLIAEVDARNATGSKRANTKQSVAIFRNALAVERLKAGDEVIAWDGSRLVKGTYLRRQFGEHLVKVSNSRETLCLCLLPLAVAVREGAWSFKPGAKAVAYVGERWIVVTWHGFEEGYHDVELSDGRRVKSDRAHTLEDAVAAKLLVPFEQ